MNKGKLIMVGVALLALVGVGAWFLRDAQASDEAPFRYSTIERGDVEDAVSSTGTLNAVRTVAVGTQVSGKVMELFADYNDKVSRGQLLARIDPTLQGQQVRNSQASLERVQAALQQAQRDYNRNKTLYDQKVITEAEFSQFEYGLTVAKSNLTSAQVQLEQARQNLAYTEIYAPIDGIVVERNAEQGQTVAASLSAPQLFLLAQDLTQMEILASVDESDIGQIKAGQTVRFTVSAYANETFEGTVRQVRLSSSTANNVVNYTAVVSVGNADGRLLPGMTATVDFLVQRAANVLKVANSALRFRPTNEQLAEWGMDTLATGGGRPGGAPGTQGGAAAQRAPGAPTAPTAQAPRGAPGAQGARGAAAGQGARGAPGAQPGQAGQGRPGGQAGQAGGAPRMAFATLYYEKDGKVLTTRVQTGISDGSMTQIEGPDVTEGMNVISGLTQPATAAGGTTNPFQQGQQGPGGGFGGPPGGFGGGGGGGGGGRR